MKISWCDSVVAYTLRNISGADQTSGGRHCHLVERYDSACNRKDTASVGKILACRLRLLYVERRNPNRQHVLDTLLSPKYVLASASAAR